MKRETFLVVLGVSVVVSPFAGLPLSWLLYILPILGVLIVIIGISLRHDLHLRDVPAGPHDASISSPQGPQILAQ